MAASRGLTLRISGATGCSPKGEPAPPLWRGEEIGPAEVLDCMAMHVVVRDDLTMIAARR